MDILGPNFAKWIEFQSHVVLYRRDVRLSAVHFATWNICNLQSETMLWFWASI